MFSISTYTNYLKQQSCLAFLHTQITSNKNHVQLFYIHKLHQTTIMFSISTDTNYIKQKSCSAYFHTQLHKTKNMSSISTYTNYIKQKLCSAFLHTLITSNKNHVQYFYIHKLHQTKIRFSISTYAKYIKIQFLQLFKHQNHVPRFQHLSGQGQGSRQVGTIRSTSPSWVLLPRNQLGNGELPICWEIYWKIPYLVGKSMVSGKFSLNRTGS